MTRKEEINVAASKYIEDNSMPDGYIAISDHKDSFIEGANWADSHPVNMWHDVSEEPNYNELMLGIDFNGVSLYKWCGQEDSWKTFVDITKLIRWTYVSDL